MVQSTPPSTETLGPSAAKASAPDSWMVQQQHSHVPPSVKINDCNEIPPHRRTRPAESCHPINRQTQTPRWLYTRSSLFFFFSKVVSLKLSYLIQKSFPFALSSTPSMPAHSAAPVSVSFCCSRFSCGS